MQVQVDKADFKSKFISKKYIKQQTKLWSLVFKFIKKKRKKYWPNKCTCGS